MPTAKEMRMRIRSVRNLSQVTRALETVSASKVRKAVQAVTATRPYSEKAWKVLVHLARQPGGTKLHPLLAGRDKIDRTLALVVASDRGLAGAYNVNIVRHAMQFFRDYPYPVQYVTVGRKGRDMLLRRGMDIIAEFSDLPPTPSYNDISPIGRLVVDEYLQDKVDEVFIIYTEFKSMVNQTPVIRRLLPLNVDYEDERVQSFNVTHHQSNAVFIYEPDQKKILEEIVPRFTALQIYQAIFSSLASEHAARMVAMHSASENANSLVGVLQLDYNKMRQQSITNEIIDIAGGAEALAHSAAEG